MAKIRKIYDQTIKPDGSKTTIYPITSTRAVYTPEGETLDSYIKDGYFHGADLAGYKVVYELSELPLEETPFGYLMDSNLYVWVGTNGDTLDGKYQNCGPFKGPRGYDGHDGRDGRDGEPGIQGIQGPQGPAGLTGPQGAKGDKGDSGVSLGEVALTTDLDETETGKALDASAMQTIPSMVDAEEEIEEVPSNYYTRTQVDALIDTQRAARQQKENAQDAEIANFENTVTDIVNSYRPVEIYGNVTNAPDGEDLTTVNGRLKFANRPNLNGMGYCILRRDKSFEEQVVHPNTIYEIRYDFDLDGETISMPSGCVLEFRGGKLSNGTIGGSYTSITGCGHVFDSCVFTGYFAIDAAKAEWFGVSMKNDDNSTQINNALKFCRNTGIRKLTFSNGNFNVKNPILVASNDISDEGIDRRGWDIVIEGAGAGSGEYANLNVFGTTFKLSEDGFFFVNQYKASTSGWCRSGAIRNCSFFGNGANIGILINQSFPYEISNCYFSGLDEGLSITGAGYYINVFNCRFRDCNYGIKTLTDSEEYYNNEGSNNNQIHNCTFQYNTNPLAIPVGGGWHIYDCDFEPANGTISLGSGNTMNNCRIERSDESKEWLVLGDRNKIFATNIYSTGTTQNKKRVEINGKYNDLELSFNGHNVYAICDNAGDNKISIKSWIPTTLNYMMLQESDNITILGANNKLKTEQGGNLVTSALQDGGASSYADSLFPGVKIMTTDGQRSFISTEGGDFALMLMRVNANQNIRFDSTVDYENTTSNTQNIYCIKHSSAYNITRIATGNATSSIHHFGSISKDKPCFLGAINSKQPSIKIGVDYTDIYLDELTPVYCFGMAPDGYNRNPRFDYNARFWYKGRQYVCYVDGTSFKFHPFDSGTTAQRPTSYVEPGFMYYDTELDQPIWYKGSSVWVDASGTEV